MFCGRHLCGDLSSLCVRGVVRVRAADSLPGIKRYRIHCCAARGIRKRPWEVLRRATAHLGLQRP